MKFAKTVLLGLFLAPTAAAAQEDAGTQIMAVVEQFSDAIIESDSAKMASLYAWAEIPFYATMGGQARGGRPRMNGAGFASMIARMSGGEEKFENVVIDASGGVATMRSDYGFYQGGELSNSGTEMWTLINTPNGWKIVSVIWSM